MNGNGVGREALDVERIRRDFPILERVINGHPLVYLDSAATSQKPRQVIEAVSDFYANHNANAHRGIYTLGEESTEAFEGARAKLARFFGAPDPRTIVFTRGTTESLNLVAQGWGRKFLQEGDEVLLTDMEHHSNIVPWQLTAQVTGAVLRYIPLTDDGQLDLSELGSLLNEKTKILSVTGMSNALGTITPLGQLVEAAHAVGALVAVDAAQLVPHNGVSVAELDCDFLAFSGHKMLGPTASGGLYAKAEHLEAMDPMFGGGEMIHEVFHDHSTWKDIPYKFEAGTMQIAQQVGLGCRGRLPRRRSGWTPIRAHEEEITRYALDRLLSVDATVYGPKDAAARGGAVSFWYRDVHPHDLATVLDAEGVAIRAGHHCAQLVMRRFGTPATARASFYVYNTRDEVDVLVDALAKAEEFFSSLAFGGDVALDDIYKETILDHYKNPRNKRELPGAVVTCTRNNPLCGDEITVSANLEDGKLLEVTFQGAGCSISQSSASMMTESVGGKTGRGRDGPRRPTCAGCWRARWSPTRTHSATSSR